MNTNVYLYTDDSIIQEYFSRRLSFIIATILIISFFENYISQYYWNFLSKIANRVYFTLEIWLVLEILINKIKSFKINIYFLLTFSTILSFLINGSSIQGLIYYTKLYILPLIVLIWSYYLKEKLLLKIILYLYLFNLLLNVTWLIGINPLPNIYRNDWVDLAIGTIDSTFFGFLSIIGLMYCIVFKRFFFAILFLFGLIITNSLTLFVIALIISIPAFKLKIKYMFVIIVLMTGIISIYTTHIPNWYESHLLRFKSLSITNIYKYEMYDAFTKDFLANPTNLLFGFGPGERTSGASEAISSDYFLSAVSRYSESIFLRGGSILDHFDSGITSIIWEIGLIGFILWTAVFYTFLVNKQLTKSDRYFNLLIIFLLFLSQLIFDFFRKSNLAIIISIFYGISASGISDYFVKQSVNDCKKY